MDRCQKIFGLLTLFICMGLPINALGSESDVWDKMKAGISIQNNGGKKFTTAQGKFYTGGGARIRMASPTITLASFTPPSFSVGCNGISATLGAISWANSEEIEQLLANIGQGALMAVAMLTMKATCPQCSAVIEAVQSAIQAANAFSKDACTWAGGFQTMLENGAKGMKGWGTDAGDDHSFLPDITNFDLRSSTGMFSGINPSKQNDALSADCAELEMKNGATDPAEAAEKCKGAGGSVKRIFNYINGISPTSWVLTDQEKVDGLAVAGNPTHWSFKVLGLKDAAGTYGTETAKAVSSLWNSIQDAQTKTPEQDTKIMAVASPGVLITLLMCGRLAVGDGIPAAELTNIGGVNSFTYAICNSISPRLTLMTKCADPDATDCPKLDTTATYIDLKKAADEYTKILSGTSVSTSNLGIVHTLDKTIQGTIDKLTDTTLTIEDSDRIHTIVQNTSYPIGRMINLSLIYPAESRNALGNFIILMSYDIAAAVFNNFMRQVNAQNSKSVALPNEVMVAASSALGAAAGFAESQIKAMGTRMQLEELLLVQVRALDQLVQKEAYSTGFAQQVMMARELR